MVISESPVIEAEVPQKVGKKHGAVLITGRGTNVSFHLDEDIPLDQVAGELDAQLAGHSALFSEGGISVNTGNRILTDSEEEEIRRIFKEKSGLKISQFVSSDSQAVVEQKPKVEDPPVRRTRSPSTPLAEFSSADLARALSGLFLPRPAQPRPRHDNPGHRPLWRVSQPRW